MYQPGKLSAMIVQARLNGHYDVLHNLVRAQAAMDLQNHMHDHRNAIPAWRAKCEVLSIDNIDFGIID